MSRYSTTVLGERETPDSSGMRGCTPGGQSARAIVGADLNLEAGGSPRLTPNKSL